MESCFGSRGSLEARGSIELKIVLYDAVRFALRGSFCTASIMGLRSTEPYVQAKWTGSHSVLYSNIVHA
jgi:hypothetical protein